MTPPSPTAAPPTVAVTLEPELFWNQGQRQDISEPAMKQDLKKAMDVAIGEMYIAMKTKEKMEAIQRRRRMMFAYSRTPLNLLNIFAF